MSMELVNVNIGLLGCGTVGASLCKLIDEQSDAIAERTGLKLAVVMVAVRDVSQSRDVPLDPSLFTNDSNSVIESPEVDVVVEVIGGIEPSKELILKALELGKPVVTANKELLAAHGGELYSLAKESEIFIGNSSSGIMEIPFLNVPVINIGSRQKNRFNFSDILHVEAKNQKITK